jgi:hypothetical protein
MNTIDSRFHRSFATGCLSLVLFAGALCLPERAGAQAVGGTAAVDDWYQKSVPGTVERVRSDPRMEGLNLTIDDEGRRALRQLGVREYLRRLLLQNEVPVDGLRFDEATLTRALMETGRAQCRTVSGRGGETSMTCA